MGIKSIETYISAKDSVDIYAGRGLIELDVNDGYECVMCITSYWAVKVFSQVGNNAINVSQSSNGQTITVTNLTDSDIKITYRRFGV